MRDGSLTGDIFKGHFARTVDELVALEISLRTGNDPDDLHEARVAVRRLRSYLKTFRPVLDVAWARPLRERLAGLDRCFSAARDFDVIAEMAEASGLSPGLELRVRAERDSRHAAVRGELRTERFAELLADLVYGARHPRFGESAGTPARRGLRKLLARAWKRARKRVRAFRPASGDVRLHRIRIAIKHLRYVAECIVPFAGKRAKALARQAAKLQSVLGERHDAVMAKERLDTALGISTLDFEGARSAHWRGIWRKMRAEYRKV